jgi:lipoprotein-releasing system permease protein
VAVEGAIATRYMRRLAPRGAQIHLITVALIAVAGAAQGGAWALSHRSGWFASTSLMQDVLRWIALGGIVGVVLIGFLLLLLRHFTIFTAISTFGLFLGSSALVVVLSVMNGFEQDLKGKILGANAHLLVTAPDRPFTDWAPVEQQLRSLGVGKVSPYLSNEVMISSQSNMSGVVLKGIDPQRAGEVTDLERNLEQGRLDNLLHPERLKALGLPPPDDDLEGDAPPAKIQDPGKAKPADGKKSGVDLVPVGKDGKPLSPAPPAERRTLPGVIIGRELAKSLRLYVGDDVNLISPLGDIGPAGPMPRSRAFRVAGIFYSGMYEYDTKYIYVAIPAAQKFLGMGDEITGFELRVRDPDDTPPVVAKLQRALGAGYLVQDWQELNRNLFSALKVEKVAMFIVLSFIILVAGFSIVANGIMLVREKRREIAILKSMGATDGAVLRVFLYVGMYMGALGVMAGIGVGVATCLELGRFGLQLDTEVYYISKLPVQLDWGEIAAVFGAAISIVLGATLYPALVAARLRPVDGLRYDQA